MLDLEKLATYHSSFSLAKIESSIMQMLLMPMRFSEFCTMPYLHLSLPLKPYSLRFNLDLVAPVPGTSTRILQLETGGPFLFHSFDSISFEFLVVLVSGCNVRCHYENFL